MAIHYRWWWQLNGHHVAKIWMKWNRWFRVFSYLENQNTPFHARWRDKRKENKGCDSFTQKWKLFSSSSRLHPRKEFRVEFVYFPYACRAFTVCTPVSWCGQMDLKPFLYQVSNLMQSWISWGFGMSYYFQCDFYVVLWWRGRRDCFQSACYCLVASVSALFIYMEHNDALYT